MSSLRTRWAAVGAAVAITLGAGGGIDLVRASHLWGPGAVYVPITPCRIIDTRPAHQVGPRATPLAAGDTLTVAAHGTSGDCEIPTEALALSMNVTAVNATLPTFLTIWANGEGRPEASSLNPAPGEPPTPNAVTTDLSPSGRFDIYNLQGEVHVLADVNGFYTHHTHEGYVRLPMQVVVPAAAFEARLVHSKTSTLFNLSDSVQCVHAAVELPDEAFITAVTAVVSMDNPGDTATVRLERTAFASGLLPGMAVEPYLAVESGATTTAHTLTHITDATITHSDVSNDTHYYTASVCLGSLDVLWTYIVHLTYPVA